MAILFTREIKEGDYGPDVEALGRALCRAGVFINIRIFNRAPEKWRRRMGKRKIKALLKFKARKALKNKTIPVYDEIAFKRLVRYYDGKAADLQRQYQKPITKPAKPVLIEPKQGFNSLVKYLWDEYSLGRSKYKLTDLGTYNPASRLPSGRLSDHAFWPAKAFDLGFSGYPNKDGYNFFKEMIGHEEVKYVIYGNMIWSRSRGMRRYSYGGHYNHVHVSGRY